MSEIQLVSAIKLPANQLANRFYRGGSKIAQFRATNSAGDRAPEDWVASVTTLAGDDNLGLTRLPDGSYLRDRIENDPAGWLGAEHAAAYGPDPMLLVKILNPGQRLPVHAHPDTAFARTHLHRRHGKAEAWSILEGGEIYLGLRQDIDPASLLNLVENQPAGELLNLLHKRNVEPGDIVFVPPGMLHAIGEGTLLVEAQQPEDLSILLEWSDFELDGPKDGHLGVGFDTAMTAITTTALDIGHLEHLITHPSDGWTTMPHESDAFFRMERRRIQEAATLDQGYSVMVVEEGELEIVNADRAPVPLHRGEVLLTPNAAGPSELQGNGTIIVARPPATHTR